MVFVLGESVDPDVELCIEDLLETVLVLDDCSFLFFRWPTVSRLGSTQDTSNIAKNLKRCDLQNESAEVQDGYEL